MRYLLVVLALVMVGCSDPVAPKPPPLKLCPMPTMDGVNLPPQVCVAPKGT
jgi:hypothetical protein